MFNIFNCLTFSTYKCIGLVTFNVYAMFSFVIVNLTNNYVKHLSPVKPFNKDGNGVTFTFIYKPKMAKEGSFLMHQKNKNY